MRHDIPLEHVGSELLSEARHTALFDIPLYGIDVSQLPDVHFTDKTIIEDGDHSAQILEIEGIITTVRFAFHLYNGGQNGIFDEISVERRPTKRRAKKTSSDKPMTTYAYRRTREGLEITVPNINLLSWLQDGSHDISSLPLWTTHYSYEANRFGRLWFIDKSYKAEAARFSKLVATLPHRNGSLEAIMKEPVAASNAFPETLTIESAEESSERPVVLASLSAPGTPELSCSQEFSYRLTPLDIQEALKRFILNTLPPS